jgi:hypothetical protein
MILSKIGNIDRSRNVVLCLASRRSRVVGAIEYAILRLVLLRIRAGFLLEEPQLSVSSQGYS